MHTIFGTIYHRDDWYWADVIPGLSGSDYEAIVYGQLPVVNEHILYVPGEWPRPDGSIEYAFPGRFGKAYSDHLRSTDYNVWLGQWMLKPPLGVTKRIFVGRYVDKFYVNLPSNINLVTACDPAVKTATMNSKKDSACICTSAMDEQGHIYCVDLWMKRDPTLEELAVEVLKQAMKNGSRTVVVETVNAQQWLYETVAKILADKDNEYNWPDWMKFDMKLVGFRDKRNKELRIEAGLSDPWRKERLHFKKDHMALIDQMKDYPDVQHDDAIDTFEMCVEHLVAPDKRNHAVNDPTDTFGFDFVDTRAPKRYINSGKFIL